MAAKIQEKIWKDIAEYLKNGLTQKQAYQLAGISKNCYYEKLKKDNDYKDLIKKNIEAFKQFHLNNITEHSKKDWHASAWLLERIYSDEYAKVEKVENKEVDEFSGYTDKELDQYINDFDKGTKDTKSKGHKRKTEKIKQK